MKKLWTLHVMHALSLDLLREDQHTDRHDVVERFALMLFSAKGLFLISSISKEVCTRDTQFHLLILDKF